MVDVLVVRVALLDVARKTVDGEVHFAQPDGLVNLFLPVHRDVRGTLFMPLHEFGTLNKHAARTRGRIENAPLVWFDDFHDQLDQTGWREELAALLPLSHCELAKKV